MDRYAQLIQQKKEEKRELEKKRDELVPKVNSGWHELYTIKHEIENLELEISALKASKNSRFISEKRIVSIDTQIAEKQDQKTKKEIKRDELEVEQTKRKSESEEVFASIGQCVVVINEANRIRNAALDAILEEHFNRNGYPEPLVSVAPVIKKS